MADHLEIVATPLRADEFEPFGQVLIPPAGIGRDFFNDMLENTRADAAINLSIATINPAGGLPFFARVMERHPDSSQTFLPIKVSRYLVIVAPDGPDDRPDLSQVRAFIADSHQGITYRRGVWHHGMTVLDDCASMAVLMWCDGTSGDEEFIDLATPFYVALPDASVPPATNQTV